MNGTGEISCKKFEGKRGSFLQNKINKSCKEEFEQCTRQPDYKRGNCDTMQDGELVRNDTF